MLIHLDFRLDPTPLVRVADDDPAVRAVRAVLRRWLEAAGCHVDEVAAGGALVPDVANREPQLIVTGEHALASSGARERRRFRRLASRPPMIVLTGPGDTTPPQAARLGAIAVLHEPVDRGSFLDAVQFALSALDPEPPMAA